MAMGRNCDEVGIDFITEITKTRQSAYKNTLQRRMQFLQTRVMDERHIFVALPFSTEEFQLTTCSYELNLINRVYN